MSGTREEHQGHSREPASRFRRSGQTRLMPLMVKFPAFQTLTAGLLPSGAHIDRFRRGEVGAMTATR
jgi:hypothetical protein